VRTPYTVVGISDAVSLTLGTQHTCIARASGSIDCWGANESGQLGRGTTTFGRNFRQPVMGLSRASVVAAGQTHTCAVSRDGSVACWGGNARGQLGDGTTMERSTPEVVRGLDDAVDVVAGNLHSCALRTEGTVWCWGDNSVGQLGTGNTEQSLAPVRVRELTDVAALTSGPSTSNHTCALRRDGELWCWGGNEWGQIGDGTMDTRLVAVRVLTNIASASGGAASTCAVGRDGSVVCWGRNDQGQLGDGTLGRRSTPTPVLPP
jgi:alpha-tubulin suppressor-like RCC1 family protein